MTHAVIRGDGVAACCCAWLLGRAGFAVSVERTDRPRVPAIMLSDAALALIRDIFDWPDLLSGATHIERRVVAWGDAPLAALPHSAIVVSERLLLDQLWRRQQVSDASREQAADFTLFASRPLPAGVAENSFGSRTASAAEVCLKDISSGVSCWIESLTAGWLFLIPGSRPHEPQSAWLLAVGSSIESLLAASRVIAPVIVLVDIHAGTFPVVPRITSPLSGYGWLACGTAAIAFDPICGDGTANAIREAILASAIISAAIRGEDRDALNTHYQSRLTAGFRRHLTLCRDFYRSGGSGPWWIQQLDAIERGIAWCAGALGNRPEFRYQLRGFDLIAAGTHAD